MSELSELPKLGQCPSWTMSIFVVQVALMWTMSKLDNIQVVQVGQCLSYPSYPNSDNVQVRQCLSHPNSDNLSRLSKLDNVQVGQCPSYKLSALPLLGQPIWARQCPCWTQISCPAWTMSELNIFFTSGGGGISDNLSVSPRTDVRRQTQGKTDISSLPRLITRHTQQLFQKARERVRVCVRFDEILVNPRFLADPRWLSVCLMCGQSMTALHMAPVNRCA